MAGAGNLGVVGAPGVGPPSEAQGAAYFYSNLSEGGTHVFTVEGLAPAYRLGESAAMSGNTAVVGATGPGTPGSTGAVHVFVNNGLWAAQDILLPSDGNSGDDFGEFV